MPDITNMSVLMGLAATVTTLGGAYLTVQKVLKSMRVSKERHAAKILQSAKESDAVIKLKLDNQIGDLEADLKNFKESVQKDMAHLKETYNGELRFLGQKIEELRNEVHLQHSQLVALLMKMLDK